MRKRIFRRMCLLSVGICILTYAVLLLVCNSVSGRQMEDHVQSETWCLAEMVNLLKGTDTILGYLQSVEEVTQARITWIDTDGTVLYDSEEDPQDMDNHLDRPEVVQAMENGAANEVRQSSTLSVRTYYYAVLLSEGSVLRLSMSMRSIYAMFFTLLPVLIVLLAVFIGAAVWAARRMTDEIIRPINDMDLFQANLVCPYEELQPLMERIRHQNEERMENETMRREFSANVSHEMKTPLTTISGYAELMKDGMVQGEDVQTFSAKIYREAVRMIELVNDTIMISRLDEHRIDLEKEPVNLLALAEDIAQRLEDIAAKSDIEVRVQGDPVVVNGIAQMLDELVYNLTENAIKYNRPKGKVIVRVDAFMNRGRIVVSDTGIGIPKEQQERVFERFYRVDQSHSRKTGGTGLGLSIVKHVVEFHDGRIDLESEVGVGTRITVII